jgi:4'-phosphopantetheinyl transferase
VSSEPGWTSPPDRPRARAGDVQVWRLDLEPDPGQARSAYALLSPDEMARAGRFRAAADRDRFVVGRAALRAILGRYLCEAPRALRFEYGPHGKPSLGGRPTERSLRFSMAHSGGLGLCAVTRDREIGVDVERVREELAGDRIAERFFSPSEADALRGLPPPARVQAFFELWTCKEAYVKALGSGLSTPLRAFGVALAAGAPPYLLHAESVCEVSRWSFRMLSPAPGHAAALAVEGPVSEVALWRFQGLEPADSAPRRVAARRGVEEP